MEVGSEHLAGLAAGVIAAVHVQGDRARLVVATRKETGWTVVGRTTLAAGDAAALNGELSRARAGLLVRVVPSAQTIARAVVLQESERTANDAEVVSALDLLAESELPGTLPEFRRVGGVLPIGGEGSGGTPVVIGWNGAVPTGPARGGMACPVVWTAEIVALAALARAASGGGVGRAVALAACVDRRDRACAVIAIPAAGAGAGKTVVRVTRLGGDDAGAAAARIIGDSARVAQGGGAGESDIEQFVRSGVGGARGGAAGFGVAVSPEPRGSVLGVAMDERTLDEFGIAMGAIIAATSERPTVRSLVNLHEREPRGRAMLVERAVRWLGTPARGVAVLAVCLAALLAAPLGVAYARYTTLRDRTKADTGLEDRLRSGEQELAHYRLLREKRWPMTKLMADVAGAAPVGVTLDSIELSSESGVTLRGTAESGDLITTFRENLGKTKVFAQVATPSIGTGSGGFTSGAGGGEAEVSFQLTAKVAPGGSTYVAPPIEDFAKKTLSERLYGEGKVATRGSGRSGGAGARASATSGSGRGSASAGSTTRGANGASRARGESGATSAGGTTRSGTGAAPKPEVPGVLTDAEIKKLDRGQAMQEWAKRKAAAAQPGLDAATRARLADESAKAKERMDALRNAGGAK